MKTVKEKILAMYQTLTRPPSYEQIAQKLGTDKTYVARVVQEFKRKNYVSTKTK